MWNAWKFVLVAVIIIAILIVLNAKNISYVPLFGVIQPCTKHNIPIDETLTVSAGKFRIAPDQISKLIVPPDHIGYYFGGPCPGYKDNILIVEYSREEGSEEIGVREESEGKEEGKEGSTEGEGKSVIEGRMDKYYLPEEGYAIIVHKNHSWTNKPTYEYKTIGTSEYLEIPRSQD
jgi:hypothetical protein